MPKWDAQEAEMERNGITPEPTREGWDIRARNWFLAHGCEYDMKTGNIVESDSRVRVPREKWIEVTTEIKAGKLKFAPDREKDLLTLVLGNPEKGGRTRGFGPSVPWSLGFPADAETYRSRARAKQRELEVQNDRMAEFQRRLDQQQREIQQQQLEINELKGQRQPDNTAGISQQRDSSVADSEVAPPLKMIDGGPGDPMDGIKEQTPCDLHDVFRNVSVKVAVGYVLPAFGAEGEPATWHGNEIPAGYARVGVDSVVPSWETLQLDIPGAPEPYTEKQKAYATSFLNTPSQYDLHEKKDDYTRHLARVIDDKAKKKKEDDEAKKKEDGKAKEKDSASTSKSSAGKKTSAPLKAPKQTTKGKKRKEVSQLGEQAKQSIPALKVFDVPKLYREHGEGFNMEEAEALAASMSCTVEELLSAADVALPFADIAPTFVYGADLVRERLHKMPTHMRNLHQWYLDACKENQRYIVAKIPREYYYRKEEIHIEMNELWQLFNLEALDKSLMSCYCLLKISECKNNLTCYECLSSASLEAPTLCPDDKDTTLFYDGCTVRFSDQDFLSSWDNTPEVVLNNTNTVEPTAAARSFDMLVGTLMEKIAEHAAASDAHDKKVSSGEAVLDGDDPQMKIYGLAQCTPDMTSSGCGKCLRGEMDKMASRMHGSLGQRVAGVRCNLRFEVYPSISARPWFRLERPRHRLHRQNRVRRRLLNH
ncbi:hypothetical protein QYE76_040853 [Lolium multiflorum]|uniref:Gnk2-homologous domain-containing protein n=1 Tax=Lolium multiflorum TaxID=4521 RepID=A0AAD8TCD4_LOLMU|nr:hypothetical protein QYE76_040853 [Lolium multiflorum]